MNTTTLRELGISELANFASVLAKSEVLFKTSISLFIDKTEVAKKMDHVRIAALLDKIEGHGKVPQALYNEIKELEDVVLTYFSGSKITNGKVRSDDFAVYLMRGNLSQVEVLDFIYRLEIHGKQIQNYGYTANYDYVYAQYLRINSFFGSTSPKSELVSALLDRTVTQADLRKLLDYAYTKLSDQIDMAKENINSVRNKYPEIISAIDKAAAAAGKEYVTLKQKPLQYVNKQVSACSELYPVVKSCLKYQRDFFIVGAENSLLLTGNILGAAYLEKRSELLKEKQTAIDALLGGDNYEQECKEIIAKYESDLSQLRETEYEEKCNLDKGANFTLEVERVEDVYREKRKDLENTKEELLSNVHYDANYRNQLEALDVEFHQRKMRLLEDDSLFENQLIKSDVSNIVGRMKWHRNQLSFYADTNKLYLDVMDLYRSLNLYTKQNNTENASKEAVSV